MFFKTCTTLMTFIIACHAACNTQIHSCDESISQKILEEPQLEPTDLTFLQKKTFWVGASTPFKTTFDSLKIHFNSFETNLCTANYYSYDKAGKILNSKNVSFSEVRGVNVKETYVVSDEFTASFSMKCGKHAIAKYQCQVEGSGLESEYAILVPIERKAAEMKQEISDCIQKLIKIDSCAEKIELKNYPCC